MALWLSVVPHATRGIQNVLHTVKIVSLHSKTRVSATDECPNKKSASLYKLSK